MTGCVNPPILRLVHSIEKLASPETAGVRQNRGVYGGVKRVMVNDQTKPYQTLDTYTFMCLHKCSVEYPGGDRQLSNYSYLPLYYSRMRVS